MAGGSSLPCLRRRKPDIPQAVSSPWDFGFRVEITPMILVAVHHVSCDLMAGVNDLARGRRALERIVFGAVAIATLAIGGARPEVTFTPLPVQVIAGRA